LKAQKLVESHPQGSEIEFVWADKVAEHLNTTDVWKSLTTVFNIEGADRRTESLVVMDRYNYNYKNFGGNFNKVTDLTDKELDIQAFVTSILDGNAKGMTALTTPLFVEPPPPPYTQEDITKMFVTFIVCAGAIAALAWSYVTFKKEQAIKEELEKGAGKKKEKRDGEYSTGE